MSSDSPFIIGSRVTLISTGDIRYEGTLVMMDRSTSTVTLSNVESFGTDDRKQETFVPPSSEILDSIVFHTSDINDLYPCVPPNVFTADAAAARPWTAEFDTTFGMKTKYNLPPGAETFTLPAERTGPQSSFVRSPNTKALREQWAAGAPKGVDFERKSAGVPPTANASEPREHLIQGYFEHNHPALNGDRRL